MRPPGPFRHQQCELANVPIFPGDLLPFAAVITGDPMWEKGRVRPRLRRVSMSDQGDFISADHFRPDSYKQCRTAERRMVPDCHRTQLGVDRCPSPPVFTSVWSTRIRIMVLEHSPHSQKCSSRLLPVSKTKRTDRSCHPAGSGVPACSRDWRIG